MHTQHRNLLCGRVDLSYQMIQIMSKKNICFLFCLRDCIISRLCVLFGECTTDFFNAFFIYSRIQKISLGENLYNIKLLIEKVETPNLGNYDFRAKNQFGIAKSSVILYGMYSRSKFSIHPLLIFLTSD
jgi:hypothetical protein